MSWTLWYRRESASGHPDTPPSSQVAAPGRQDPRPTDPLSSSWTACFAASSSSWAKHGDLLMARLFGVGHRPLPSLGPLDLWCVLCTGPARGTRLQPGPMPSWYRHTPAGPHGLTLSSFGHLLYICFLSPATQMLARLLCSWPSFKLEFCYFCDLLFLSHALLLHLQLIIHMIHAPSSHPPTALDSHSPPPLHQESATGGSSLSTNRNSPTDLNFVAGIGAILWFAHSIDSHSTTWWCKPHQHNHTIALASPLPP